VSTRCHQPGPSPAAASSGTSTSLIGVASPCAAPLRAMTPLRMSHSSGLPCSRSVSIEVVMSSGTSVNVP
jgi:hypothetical protein